MGKTTRMEYALSVGETVYDATCGSLANARRAARKLRANLPKTMPVEIWRYDRSASSGYYEFVEPI